MGASFREKGAALRPLFEALEHGFNELSKEYHFCAEIGGKKLKLCFTSREHAGIIERYLAGLRIPETRSPDAQFCFWTDDCSRYIGPEGHSERWRYREEGGCAIFAPGSNVIGADLSGRAFYCCLHNSPPCARVPYWAAGTLVSQWAGKAGLLPAHGGAVGVEGRGVLLAARGGGGKSTLAASCLLAGMDYVADDYVLISAEGPPRAMPMSSSLKMNPDMKERLGLTMPVIWEDAAQGGKQLLDASAFPICRDMAVRAVVFLSRWERAQAEISPLSGHSALRLAQSAPRVEGAYDPYTAKAIVQRLSRLPAFEMRLGGDLKQNADTLRTWIERMK